MNFGDTTRRDALARVLCARVCDERRTISELRRLDSALVEIERERDGDPLRVYIGGSSAPSELERVEQAGSALIAYGIEVVSTWVDLVRKNGGGNPKAARTERFTWSVKDLDEVASGDALLFLAPRNTPSFGAGVELGAAWMLGKPIVAAGDTTSSIFCALGHEFASDLDAIAFLVKMARRRG